MESCGGKCAKYILILFNLIFVISGAGVMGVGIWIRVDTNIEQLAQLLSVSVDGYLYTAAYILIGFGAFVFLVGFLGCCGALTENKCMLGTYIFFLVLIFAGELGGGIAAAVYKDKALGQLRPSLTGSFQHYEARTNTTSGNAIAVAWDYMQVLFECCGANNSSDYSNVTFSEPNMVVPKTCCVLSNKDPVHPEPKDLAQCEADAKNKVTTSENFHVDNCFQGVENMLKKHTNILIGVGCGIAFLQLLGVVLACCVCRGSSKTGYN